MTRSRNDIHNLFPIGIAVSKVGSSLTLENKKEVAAKWLRRRSFDQEVLSSSPESAKAFLPLLFLFYLRQSVLNLAPRIGCNSPLFFLQS